CDEAISQTRSCLYVPRLRGIVAERCAHLADRGLENGFADVTMTPDFIQQLVLARQLSRLARQRTQHCERFRRQLNGTTVPGQLRIGLIELELIEAYWHTRGLRSGRRAPRPAFGLPRRAAPARRGLPHFCLRGLAQILFARGTDADDPARPFA